MPASTAFSTVELAAPGVLAPGRPTGLFDRGAGAAARQAVEDPPAAAGAEPGGTPFDILLPFRRLALVAARRAGCSALNRRMLAAADAQAGLAPRLLALPALGACAAALGVRIGAAVEHAGGLARRIAGAVGSAAFLQARLAGNAVGGCRRLAAPGAHSFRNARGGLAAGPLAFAGARLHRVAARPAFRPEPGIAGTARAVPFLRTLVADAALRRGRAVAAPGTKTLCNAFRSALAEAFAVALAADRRIPVGHRRPPSV